MLSHVLAAGLLAAASALTPVEQATFAGKLEQAYRLTDAGPHAAPAARFSLLLQRARVHHFARLSGQPAADEIQTLDALHAQAASVSPDLRAQALHARLVTTYFRQLTGAEKEDFLALRPGFIKLAQELEHPCHKADAEFFAALMLQVSNKVLESADGLEQARRTATAGGCDIELSYALRHLAEVAEVQGNLAKAAQLAEQSLDLRRRLGMTIYLPYSLLQTADIASKRGDRAKAQRDRAEAARIAAKLGLPAQMKATRDAVAAARP